MAFFPHLDPARRALIVGAIAGVVLEFCLIGAYLMTHGATEGAPAPARPRWGDAWPCVAIGALALAVGVGAFGQAAFLTLRPQPKPRRPRGKKRAAR